MPTPLGAALNQLSVPYEAHLFGPVLVLSYKYVC